MDLKRGDPDKRALLLAGNRRGNSIPVKEKAAGRCLEDTPCADVLPAALFRDPYA